MIEIKGGWERMQEEGEGKEIRWGGERRGEEGEEGDD